MLRVDALCRFHDRLSGFGIIVWKKKEGKDKYSIRRLYYINHHLIICSLCGHDTIKFKDFIRCHRVENILTIETRFHGNVVLRVPVMKDVIAIHVVLHDFCC